MSEGLPPGLHIVATPIGNLGDLSERAAETLRRADRILVEDTRVTAKLLHHIGARVPMTRYDDHSSEAERERIVAELGEQAIALVSDAGTPLISDPGYKLVRAARAAGHAVHTIPGPVRGDRRAHPRRACRPTASCSSASFPRRRRRAADAIAEVAGIRATLVLYESGPRLGETLTALADALGDREAAVAREISKLHEECVTGIARRSRAPLRDSRAEGRNRDRRRAAASKPRQRAKRSSTPRSTKRCSICRLRARRRRSPKR